VKYTDRRFWLFGFILVVAIVVRFALLGREALWCDEAYTAFNVRMPPGELISFLLRTDDAPPFFYMVVKSITTFFGDSEAALRTASALAGVLGVGVLLWLAHRRHDSAYGWSAAFMSVAVYGVFHSRQARSYMLVIFLALIVVLSVKEMLERNRRGGPVFAVSCFLLCMTHHAAVVLLLTSLLLWPLRRPPLKSWLLWHGLPLVAWAVYWTVGWSQFGTHQEGNAWTAVYWETHSLSLAPFYSLGVFLPGGLPPGQIGSGFAVIKNLSISWTILSVLLGVSCVVAAFVRARREIITQSLLLFLPLAALMIASYITTPVYVLTRTDAIAYPAFVLLIGHGLSRLPRPIAVLMLLFWAIVSLGALVPSQKGTDRHLAMEMASAGLAHDDWVIHSFMTAPAVEYYLERFEAPHKIAYFPKAAGENNASNRSAPVDSLDVYVQEATELRNTLDGTLSENGSVWIFVYVEPNAYYALRRGDGKGTITVAQIGYPVSALVYALVGAEPVRPASLFTQDWLGGHHALLRISHSDWVPVEEIPPIYNEEP
jgi:hypothetical protein